MGESGRHGGCVFGVGDGKEVDGGVGGGRNGRFCRPPHRLKRNRLRHRQLRPLFHIDWIDNMGNFQQEGSQFARNLEAVNLIFWGMPTYPNPIRPRCNNRLVIHIECVNCSTTYGSRPNDPCSILAPNKM